MAQNKNIVIIGGGLSGLSLAYFLSKNHIKSTILEGATRLGGRIQTVEGALGTPMELGATWFSDMHPHLLALIDELGLEKHPQFSQGKSFFQTKSFEPPQEFYVPASEAPSFRVVGGTERLIDTLSQKIPAEAVALNARVSAIKELENQLLVETNNGTGFRADKVVLCLPPQLVASIRFSPGLPDQVSQLLPSVQTWMAGAVKFVLEYETPFWKKVGYSGMLYSHAGIVAEMYDHTNFEQSKFGFTGFLNGGAASYPPGVRKELVLGQLEEILGKEALKPTAYFDKVWTDEFVWGGDQLIQVPHQNQGHPLLQQSYLGEKLFFSGTEAAPEFPGYMEGAVIAARRMADQLING